MFNIGGFFQKFLSLQSKEVEVRNFIADSINKNIGITISIGDIDIKDGVVYIKNLSQAAKNTLFMKKNIIIDEVNFLSPIRKIKAIRY